ncbi:DUF6262 family protein [Kitasatospora sp. NBC_01287]|uniref:DUF6262 family protein n=1 Tax=Kitasatospora sp. NBC_01287 TaxID=2903573 RepID=UPI00224E42A1|nr:DUF6262 family protein [Kitasatospora sp. NBC_01287]MCX4745536.1 DUF6262 family protein [Kitasatospora sp. NBC_01287]
MTTKPSAGERLAQGRRDDSARRRQRVLKVVNQLAREGGSVSVSAVARGAGVDRTFLYRHPDLLAHVHALAAEPPPNPGKGPTVSRASLQADLLAANARSTRLAEQIRQLEQRLSEALGEQVWRNSGIGPPSDIDRLQARITELEQQNLDLHLQLDERDEELNAARTANRELTKTINHETGRTT